jgi:threonine dehydrogenase-like Zn-dependent dehydrogenase
VTTVMAEVAAGRLDVSRLVTDVVDAADVAAAFEKLDRGDPDTLQVVLRFDAAPRQ